MIAGERIATGEVALALRFARETGAPLPRTTRRLHQIIGAASGTAYEAPGGTLTGLGSH